MKFQTGVLLLLLLLIKSNVESKDCSLLSNNQPIYTLESDEFKLHTNPNLEFNRVKVKSGCLAKLIYESDRNYETFDENFKFGTFKKMPKMFVCFCRNETSKLNFVESKDLISSFGMDGSFDYYNSSFIVGGRARVRFSFEPCKSNQKEIYILVGKIKVAISDDSIRLADDCPFKDAFLIKEHAFPPIKLLHFNASETNLWFSVDSFHSFRILFGFGYIMQDTILVSFNLKNETKHKDLLKEVKSFEVDRNVNIVNMPSIYQNSFHGDYPPVILSSPTLDYLDSNGITPSMLPIEGQQLYSSVERINLEKDVIDAINFSLDNDGCVLNKKIKGKKPFGGDTKRSYIRVSLENTNHIAPGLPFVLEIWPKGHYSPIHNHGDTIAVIKVLHGSITSEYYDPLANVSCTPPRLIKSVKVFKDDITWMTPDYYQTHRLFNHNSDSATITIQAYSHVLSAHNNNKNNNKAFSETFNYIIPNNCHIQYFFPTSDFLYRDFKEALIREFRKGKCYEEVKNDCSLIKYSKCGSFLKTLNVFQNITANLADDKIYQCNSSTGSLVEVDDCSKYDQVCSTKSSKCEEISIPKARVIFQGTNSYSSTISGIIDLVESNSNIVEVNGKIFGLNPKYKYKLMIHQSNDSSTNCYNAGPRFANTEIYLNESSFGVRRVKASLDRFTLKPITDLSLLDRSFVLHELIKVNPSITINRPVACGLVLPLGQEKTFRIFENGFIRSNSKKFSFDFGAKEGAKLKSIKFYNDSTNINGIQLMYEDPKYDVNYGSIENSIGYSFLITDDMKIMSVEVGYTANVKSIKFDVLSNAKIKSFTFGTYNMLNSNRFLLINNAGFKVAGFFGSYQDKIQTFGLLIREEVNMENTFKLQSLKANAEIYGSFEESEVTGNVNFYQESPYEPINVSIDIQGLAPNSKHGFHVHALGVEVNQDNSPKICDDSGAHFNPLNLVHGQISAGKRHAGDYGNIVTDNNGRAKITLIDPLSELIGPFSIVGKTIVLHEKEDDLGMVNDEGSKKTGNAGSRIACGLIKLNQENVDCMVSEWSKWSDCQMKSNKLVKFRERTIKINKKNSGLSCPKLEETIICEAKESFKMVESVSLKNKILSYNVNNENECKKKCSEDERCVAVTFSTDKQDINDNCNLFCNTSYVAFEDPNKRAFAKKNLNLPIGRLHENIRLERPYKTLKSIENENMCWSQCIRNESDVCVAITFSLSNQECRFYRKNSYLAFSETNWLTITRASENLKDRHVYDVKNDYAIVDSGKQSDAKDVKECWIECQNDPLCDAISFKRKSSQSDSLLSCTRFTNKKSKNLALVNEKNEIIFFKSQLKYQIYNKYKYTEIENLDTDDKLSSIESDQECLNSCQERKNNCFGVSYSFEIKLCLIISVLDKNMSKEQSNSFHTYILADYDFKASKM